MIASKITPSRYFLRKAHRRHIRKERSNRAHQVGKARNGLHLVHQAEVLPFGRLHSHLSLLFFHMLFRDIRNEDIVQTAHALALGVVAIVVYPAHFSVLAGYAVHDMVDILIAVLYLLID